MVSKTGVAFLIFCTTAYGDVLDGFLKADKTDATLYPAAVPVKTQDGNTSCKWGYINRQGKMVIEPQFDAAWNFFQGLACVNIGGEARYGPPGVVEWGRWGHVDPNGTLVVPARYTMVGQYREGLAKAVHEDEGLQYIDLDGNVVRIKQVESMWPKASEFCNGLAAVESMDTWGYIDRKGNWAIRPKYQYAWGFSEGLGCVNVGGKPAPLDLVDGGKYGFVDKSGKMVIKAEFECAYPFSEGLAPVNVGGRGLTWMCIGGKWGFIDPNGKMVVEPQFAWAWPFAGGLSSVNVGGKTEGGMIEGGKWGYLDKSGRFVIKAQYDGCYMFSGGLAAVNMGGRPKMGGGADGGKWGYIDPTGQTVVPFRFEDAGYFIGDLAYVKDGGVWVYINKKGEVVWRPPEIPAPAQAPHGGATNP